MKKTQNVLMWYFWLPVIISLLLVVAYESNLVLNGYWATNSTLQFILATFMELLTVCIIPLALRLFRYSRISRSLTKGTDEERAASLLKWGTVRINMLGIPLVLNILLSYLTQGVSFWYMGIILALCLFFVYPSMSRCLSETTSADNTEAA
ncbi:MAG: hypothetical protein IJ196_06130 [Prevotella sp.]|nr:hypothetical protein [Prevotella sp.]